MPTIIFAIIGKILLGVSSYLKNNIKPTGYNSTMNH